MTLNSKKSKLTMVLKSEIASLSTSVMKIEFLKKNSSPYTPEQNGAAERKNRTLIEAARTMLSRSVFSKHYWNEAIATACYTQNRSIIVKRHLENPYQTNNNEVSFIEPYESPELVVLKPEVSFDQNGQADQNDLNDQNDQSAQTDEILNDDQSEHSNHANDENIIDNLLNTKDIQISEHLSSPNVEDTSVQDTILIHNPSLSIPSMTSPAPQDRWS
ncbi:retrovirus-related pol polyprotein from transposon TNT 1-94 [Tanacetum coccineum]